MRPLLSALIAAAVALAACGGATSVPPAGNDRDHPDSATATARHRDRRRDGDRRVLGPAKASANNATAAQLQAAFEAAGVPNASRWVVEVRSTGRTHRRCDVREAEEQPREIQPFGRHAEPDPGGA